MAKKRVQVEKLQPSARLQAIARPVETYVRPSRVQPVESGLSAFVKEIAPAVQSLADIEKQKVLKKNREIEKGNARKKAFDAQLLAGRALREAQQDFNTSSLEYMDLTEEQLADRRQGIMQPYFDRVAESGDEELITAFTQDIQVGNLDFLNRFYDPYKIGYDKDKQLNTVGTELIAISDNPDNAKAVNEAGVTVASQQINNLLTNFQKVNGIPWREINEYVLKIATERAASNGRDALYNWLEKNNILGVARYQDTVRC